MTYKIKKPTPVDKVLYSNDHPNEAKYGLPKDVVFCQSCVMSNQKPNSAVEFKNTATTKKETIHIDNDGICDACKYAQIKKQTISWSEREEELKELCNRFRRNDGRYDCIVPGSGGKDSFYTAHMLKYKYGMHPLTVTFAPHIYTTWGWHNQESWIHAGFDNYLFSSNGLVHRLLTRLAVEKLFHPFQPFFFGQKFLAPKMAVTLDIPLVFYGENEAEYGNKIKDNTTAKRDWSYFAESDPSKIFLAATSIEELIQSYGVQPVDLNAYYPANPEQLEQKKVEVHYLGYYLKWHPQACYYYAIENSDFQVCPERHPGTYSKYASLDDKIDDFNFFTTHIKFGIGRATYDASQEIRSGDITREEGVALVKRFDGEYPERFANDVFKYLSLPEKQFPIASKMFEEPLFNKEYFMLLADQFRSPHLWKYENGAWKLRAAVYDS